MISLAKTLINPEKLNQLIELLEVVDYNPHTKTLTVNSDIKLAVRGEYKIEAEEHVKINSGYTEKDKKLNIPYSVFINSDEQEFKNIQKEAKDILDEYNDEMDNIQNSFK